MLKRLWIVTSVGWAFFFLLNGASKDGGIGIGDLAIAAMSILGGFLLWKCANFVASGR